jgi:uncharacterized protein with ParB-like and HNH nuclease domain
MQLPQPTHAKYSGLLNDIKRGQIKIPQFQRDFVWSLQKSAALIDSIVKVTRSGHLFSGQPRNASVMYGT